MADHYAELEIQQTASSADILTAYRRMALLHHPDKNPENIVAATARFQRIQLAYETLSDDTKRRQYDARQNTGNEDGDTPYMSFDRFAEFIRRFNDYTERMREEAMQQAAYEQKIRQAQRDYQEKICKQRREELEKREKEEAKQRAAKQAAKQAQEAKVERAREDAFDQETRKQAARWQNAGAVTEEEKLLTCLHSDFCAKIPQQKKFKCHTCGAKRGMTAFVCPHCGLHLCQLCLTNFADRRARDEKPKLVQQRPKTSIPSPQAEEEPKGQADRKPKSQKAKGISTNPTTPSKQPKPEIQSMNGGSKPKLCLTCGKPGHFAAACRAPRHTLKKGISHDRNHDLANGQADAPVQARNGLASGKSGVSYGKQSQMRGQGVCQQKKASETDA